jgi:hypothetical protein
MPDPEIAVVWPAEDHYPEQRYAPPPVGLEPHSFAIEEHDELPVEKLELFGGGKLFGVAFYQEAMLAALLSKVALRRAVQLVPRERWLAALDERC